MLNPIFTEKQLFEQEFSNNLEKMLENNELGVFILVLQMHYLMKNSGEHSNLY